MPIFSMLSTWITLDWPVYPFMNFIVIISKQPPTPAFMCSSARHSNHLTKQYIEIFFKVKVGYLC